MYETEDEFLSKIDNEGGIEMAIDGYGLKSKDCPPGKVKDAFAFIEKTINSEEYQAAKDIIETAISKMHYSDEDDYEDDYEDEDGD